MGDLTLTSLANDIFVAADVVGREAVGFIPSVTMNAESTRAAVGDNVTAAFTAEAGALQDISNGNMTIPDGTAQTITGKTLNIDNAKAIQIPFGAEQEKLFRNTGRYESVYGDLIQQAMRKIVNQIESDLFTEVKNNAGFATGVQGTTPFATGTNDSGLEEIGTARKILVDSGCPMDDVSLVCNTSASLNIRNNLNLISANIAGNTDLREQGILIPVQGINIRESGQIASHTAGTAAADGLIDTVDNAGATSIVVDDLDDGATIVAGDILETDTQDAADAFAVVGTGATAGSAGADSNSVTVTLNQGLKAATANNEALRLLSYTGNFMFHRAAVELAMRAPAVPQVGDAADDAITVQDPHSGLVFEVRIYKGYRKTMIEVGAAYGIKAWKPEFIHTILG